MGMRKILNISTLSIYPRAALVAGLAVLALGPLSSANAQTGKASPPAASAATAASSAIDIDRMPENSWLTLRGKVKSQSVDGFVLNNTAGDVTVEVKDSQWFDKARSNLTGKTVTVSGTVDDDLFDRRTLKASSIRVDGNYHYDMKKEESGGFYILPLAVATEEGIFVNMRGDIQSVDKNNVKLKTKAGTVDVGLARMGFEQSLKTGQRVAVYGRLENVSKGLESARIRAINITPLLDDFGQSAESASNK